MTKSTKIDLSAAPNAAFNIQAETGPSEPIKKPSEAKKDDTYPSLARRLYSAREIINGSLKF